MVYKELDLIGSTLSNYKITGKLGRGGMATVYKAHELSLNRIVALKVLSAKLADDEEFIKRFQREAQAAAKLNHPNIVQIYAIGEEKGIHFFAMEYIKGKTLSEILKEKKIFNPDIAVSFIKQVAKGLSVAHKEGLVHRDIKPSNILIDKKNNAKIADFGIAFVQDAKTKLTREGSIIGTPEYLSPEQCEGKKLDGRSDIYSLGVTFYELLTGKTPYEADTPVSMIMKIVSGKFPPISEVKPDIPKKLQDIVEKMMNIDLSERYENADGLVKDLEDFEKENLLNKGDIGLGTNVLDEEEISGIVDNYQENTGSGKRAILFIAIILIILVGIAAAAKFLYFDKLDGGSTKTEAVSQEVAKTEDSQLDEPVSSEKSEDGDIINNNKSIEPEIEEKAALNDEAEKDQIPASSSDNNIIAAVDNEILSKSRIINPADNISEAKDIKSGQVKDISDRQDELVAKNKVVIPKTLSKPVKAKKKVKPLPPERSIIISLNGSNRNVELVSSYIQNRLQNKKYIIIDHIAAEGRTVKEIARSHMIISVNDMGTNTLKYYGSETTEYIVNISVKIISPLSGRIVKGPVNRTVRYTDLNVGENFKEAVDKLIRSLNL